MDFLPVDMSDLEKRNWDGLDIIIVSGDAYVDHPAWAAAILGRFLEQHSYRVGIIAQPDWRSLKDFQQLGPPRLFFAVSAGNVDSMVNHYTADKKKRHDDTYSPGGQAGHRPDRATIVYCNRLKEAYPGIPIVIGGVEASLRRLAHYDYWSEKVRRSILLDSKADLLGYGMGEYCLLEVARRLKAGKRIQDLTNLRGTCYVSTKAPAQALELPSFEEIQQSKEAFARATKLTYEQINPYNASILAQKHEDRWLVQNPPALPLTTEQMNEIYKIPFLRRAHPMYEAAGGIPALKPVQFSLVTHRGCFGGCAFCAVGLHQGKYIQNRSIDSLVQEAGAFTDHPDFTGSIPDVGAPSANMYGLSGRDLEHCEKCRRVSCLFPSLCQNLNTDQSPSVRLWKHLREIEGIKHIRVASGVRYDLILRDTSRSYLRDLCKYHVGGQLKVAPEHVSAPVTRLMGKPGREEYEAFVQAFHQTNLDLGKEQYIIPYFISGHPGSRIEETIELAEFVRDAMHYYPEQVQNFTPTPMTISTCMYYTSLNPADGSRVYVPLQSSERKAQRALLQFRNNKNPKLIRDTLKAAGRTDLIGSSARSLVRDGRFTPPAGKNR
jgi:uncharacterized radical SAM protein YgiQ